MINSLKAVSSVSLSQSNQCIEERTNLQSAESILPKNISLVSPCDAQYLTKSNKNVSFGHKYVLKRLPESELVKVKTDLFKRAEELFIRLEAWGCDFRNNNSNILIQALNYLLNHKIIENESLKDHIRSIETTLSVSLHPLEDANGMLDFADFITSDEAKSVYENESVQDAMGSIMYACDKCSYSAKVRLVKYIKDHPELLQKDVNLGKYIAQVSDSNYDTILKNLTAEVSPVNPTEGQPQARSTRSLFGTLLGEEKEIQEMGRVVTKKPGEISGFARIGGQRQAIEALEQMVLFPKRYPQFYAGRNMEKGAILYGPPGTGKSLMANALAEEYGGYFVSISATDMSDKFVGGSEENWRNLFEDLKRHQPALLFIDEIDALCKRRGGIDVHGDKELNQFLKLVSDIKAENLDVFILGATNNPNALDPAVIRAGRFGLHVQMLPPQNIEEVEEIFNIHSKSMPLDKDVEINKKQIFAKMLELGLTGADIESVINASHNEALIRLGLIEKMRKNAIDKSDSINFTVKAVDFMKALEKLVVNEAKQTSPIGYRK